MKAVFFSRPLEWSLETTGESWPQGSSVQGTLRVKNTGTDPVELSGPKVALAFADVKKVHARTEGSLKPQVEQMLPLTSLAPGEQFEQSFDLALPENCPVSDKKSSWFLTYGAAAGENHLQLRVEPRALYGKLIGLLDTFQRFKLKEFKASKKGVEYKLLPPTSRELANLESLNLGFTMQGETLELEFEFQVKKLDTEGVTNKIKKSNERITRTLSPREYSLGPGMINQDVLLKMFEGVLAEVKLKSVF